MKDEKSLHNSSFIIHPLMISLLPITPEDMDFLYRVYASTRTEELALVDWPEAQKTAFLQMQFNAQTAHYAEHYPNAQFQIILLEGTPIGRLYVDRWVKEIRIVDISLLPEYRNRGIGSGLLKEILNEGAQAGLPVTIHVEMFNPALRLYDRLGFRHIDDHGVYYLMEWKPNPTGSITETKLLTESQRM
jgi:ribosomal protein S18 acetylase RimI-like enzyme